MIVPLVDLKKQYLTIKKDIDRSINQVLRSSQYIKGPTLELFETSFAKFIGVKHCIGVASGTDALHLCLRALDIKKGDEIILPVNTFVATVYAILYIGAKPIFIDADEETFNIDVNHIENKISKRTKVILPVHLFGQPADMDKVMVLAKKYNLTVIEDSSQAHGAIYKKKLVGSIGTLSAFSFYPGKNLGAYGDAGAIVTNSSAIANRLQKLREYGGATKYLYDEIGFNSRLDALQAAILEVKLKHLNRWNAKRRSLADYYNQKLNIDTSYLITPKVSSNRTSVYYVYVIRCKNRDKLQTYLKTWGIQTGIYYPIPLHLQKSLSFLGYKKGEFPVSEKACSEILSLPMYAELTHLQQDYVINRIKRFYES